MKVKTVKTEFAEAVTFRLDPDKKHELRLKVLRENTTIQELFEKFTAKYLEN